MKTIEQGYHLLDRKSWRPQASDVRALATAMSLMLGQDFGKAPDFVERVVKRRGRNADDVRFAEIAFHAGGLEFIEQFFWMLLRQDRQLAAARVCFARRNHRKAVRGASRTGIGLAFGARTVQ